jgi:hypothetical protein
MIRYLFFSLCTIVIDATHFNGGNIRWVPVDPYDNSSSVTITIMQSYSWTYSLVTCTSNVPISTVGYSTDNANLTCLADCSTDGGYSNNPINILTNCTSSSSALDIITSESSKNVTLLSSAYFYLAYTGSNWRALNYPTQTSLTWSIVTFIDLQMRSDGFINTPPTASIISPQYVIVNEITQIQIIVSDANPGDDVRCRWSTNSIVPPVDECASVCYPGSLPNGTTLSNCTVTFQGPIVNISYAAAIQVRNDVIPLTITPLSTTL